MSQKHYVLPSKRSTQRSQTPYFGQARPNQINELQVDVTVNCVASTSFDLSGSNRPRGDLPDYDTQAAFH